ncbi:MAG: hypothetical protein JEZ04_17085 [Spirochaetales bacterium]|nr:hypothetical protein [Spirochaetales bacterium]
MKGFKRLSAFLYLFTGIGAVAGGMAGILEPQSPMGIPIEVLEHSPFGSYLLPGIFLFAVIGLGNIFSFILSRRFEEVRGYLSGIMGVILCLWLIIQCLFMRDIAALHIIFFVIGVFQGLTGLRILLYNRQFPYYEVTFFFERWKDKRHMTKTP